ncbi:DNA primase [Candidatus Parcubacteria bacterium]|nr:DNA primase [Candidatus Parcubacteria bacterium]
MLSHTEEIKSKLDVIDVLQEYIKLTPAGKNFKALCPFHQEKTPSFMVSPERQSWHCFGCSEGGDIFTFVMKMEGIEFIEALKLLAKKAGVQLKPQDPKILNRKNRLLDINELAKKFYAYLLKKSPAAESCRAYLRERKVSEQPISEFELGYAPNSWDKTTSFLESKGYKQDEILASGLIVKKDGGGRCYDRFRNRLMFPINNLHGQTVGFSARALDKSDSAKYINSPQTDIYNKSEILYGLDKAKNSIRQKNSVILVEGQMDLISAHSAGDKNSVATSGTALTETQIRILKRYSDNLLLAFDSDLAGQNAVKKGIDLAITLGMNIKVIQLQSGGDPDECIKNSPQDWLNAIKNAEPVLEYYFQQALKSFSIEDISGKKKIVKSLLPIIKKMPDLVEQNYYLKKLSQIVEVEEEILRETIKKDSKNESRRQAIKSESKKTVVKKGRDLQIAEEMAALLFKFPGIFSAVDFDLKILADEKIADFCQRLSDFYKDEQQNFSADEFVNILKQEDGALFNLSQSFLLLAEKDFLDFNLKQAEKQAAKNLRELKKSYILKQKVKIEKKIKEADKNNNEDLINKLSLRFEELNKEFFKLGG